MLAARRRTAAEQRGMTLIECIIGIFVLGSVVAAGLTGLLFSIRQTSNVNQLARTDLAVADFAEGIKQIAYLREYRPGAAFKCAAGSADTGRGATLTSGQVLAGSSGVYTSRFRTWLTSPAAAGTAAAGYLNGTSTFTGLSTTSFTVTNVRYWDALSQSWDTTVRCSNSTTDLNPAITDQGIQKVTLRIVWGPAPSQTDTIEVIKTRRQQ